MFHSYLSIATSDALFFCVSPSFVDKVWFWNTKVMHWFHFRKEKIMRTLRLRVVPPLLFRIPDGLRAKDLKAIAATLIAHDGHVYTMDPNVAQRAAELHKGKMH